jgi:hypothetical protein
VRTPPIQRKAGAGLNPRQRRRDGRRRPCFV